MSKLKIGLVGAGRIGRVHAKTIVQRVPSAQLVAIAEPQTEAAKSCAAEVGLNDSALYPNLEAMLAATELDAVLIASSTTLHTQQIIAAAAAGKHIFCEKPLAADLQQTDLALAAVEKAGVKFLVGFNRRFDSNHARIKQAIAGGQIGTPHLLHIISRDPAPPPIAYIKVSGGLFFDMTIHDFDMAYFLLGEVESLYAVGGVLVDPAIGQAGDIDTAIITLKFKNGALGTIDNSRKAIYGYDQRVEVFGSAGAARSDNIFPNAVTFSNSAGVGRDLPLNFFMDRYLDSYQAEVMAFVDCVVNDTPSPVTGQAGRTAMVMALAAAKSLQSGRPVALSEVG
jgi:myo-inositol 2-dehydrogenase / D-chiro-inositol 1-dehydrogenase